MTSSSCLPTPRAVHLCMYLYQLVLIYYDLKKLFLISSRFTVVCVFSNFFLRKTFQFANFEDLRKF